MLICASVITYAKETHQDLPKPFVVVCPGPPLRDMSELLRSLSGLLECRDMFIELRLSFSLPVKQNSRNYVIESLFSIETKLFSLYTSPSKKDNWGMIPSKRRIGFNREILAFECFLFFSHQKRCSDLIRLLNKRLFLQ